MTIRRALQMREAQELGHPEGHDYRAGSPHLKHIELHDRLVALIEDAVGDATRRGAPQTVLEIGAGHGGFTEPMLARGYVVTATEMSRPSLQYLEDHFASNPNFSAVLVADNSLSLPEIKNVRFSNILCASVLHHIPDYQAAVQALVDEHLAPGGAFVALQDPLWYPSLRRRDFLLSRMAYFMWRLTQGDYGRGMHTRMRRFRGQFTESEPSDMVEYHVVRKGVNQDALLRELVPRFESVNLRNYWSTQSALLQEVGQHLGIHNTFAIVALGRHSPTQP